MPRKTVHLACVLILVAAALPAQEKPPAPKAVPADLVAKASAILDALVRGDYATATQDFNARMKEGLPPERVQAVWSSLVAQVGPFKRQAGVRTDGSGPNPVVFVTAELEKMSLDLKVTFDAEGKVGAFFISPSKPAAPPGG